MRIIQSTVSRDTTLPCVRESGFRNWKILLVELGIGEILLVESGIGKTFACGIRDSGFYNPEYSSRNPES